MTFHQPFAAGGLCITTNDLRLNNAGLVCSEGVGAFDQLLVTATDPVSGDVEVSAGHAYISNDNSTDGGMYHVYNDAPVSLSVPLNSSGSDRTDVVWLQICDTEYGGVSEANPVYDDNNPTATPPADGCTYYLLATLVIPNGAGFGGTNVSGTPTTWGDTDAMITDERGPYGLCNVGAPRETLTLTFADSPYSFEKADYPWLRAVEVYVLGSGASGRNCVASGGASQASTSAGGGSGAPNFGLIPVHLLSATETVTIAEGGTAGLDENGASSSFGAHVIGGGGQLGGASSSTTGNSYAVGGQGGATSGTSSGLGVATTGNGAPNAAVVGGATTHNGRGANSPYGQGGLPGLNADGSNASGFGSGGGGASATASGPARDGGAGANGLVILKLYG